jgi:hypothetical protein
MTRSMSLAAMFAVAAGVWAVTPPLHAASWPVTALATEEGTMVTKTMGARDRKCRRGEVYDRELRKCVPEKEKPLAKEKPVKEKKTK